MKNNNLNLNQKFLTIFVWVIIGIANIASAVVHGINEDVPSVIFNAVIAVFCMGMAWYFMNNLSNH